MSGPSISVTLHDFLPDQTGEDRCAFVYKIGYGNPDRRCNVGRLGHKPARTGLVATREDEDVVSWDRPQKRIPGATVGEVLVVPDLQVGS